MSKYPFATLRVGDSAAVPETKLSTAHVQLSRFKAELRFDGWEEAQLPSFRLTQCGSSVIVERLQDGTKLKRGPRFLTRQELDTQRASESHATPQALRAAKGFEAWQETWSEARERGESVLPSRDLLDCLLAHRPDLHQRAVELSMQPLVWDDLTDQPDTVATAAADRTALARAAVRRGDDPHDAAFLLSLRANTLSPT